MKSFWLEGENFDVSPKGGGAPGRAEEKVLAMLKDGAHKVLM